MNPLGGSGIGFNPNAYGKIYQPGKNADQNVPAKAQDSSARAKIEKAQSVRTRDAISFNEVRSETYQAEGHTQTTIRGDRGSVIDITV